MGKHTVVISPTGELRAIYSPITATIAQAMGGPVTTRRASHVEPTAELSDGAKKELVLRYHARWDILCEKYRTKWWASMLPVGGGVLGPYTTRDEALDDERVWLEEHNIPVASEKPVLV